MLFCYADIGTVSDIYSHQHSARYYMQSKKVTVNHRYLLLPLADAGGFFVSADTQQYLGIYQDGVKKQEYELVLSENPRAWSVLYLDAYQGQEIEIRVEGAHEEMIDLLKFSDVMEDQDTLYREEKRPLVHFSAMHGYMNDPNGLVYYRGTYHLFAQLNPYGFGPGNTHWMHAVSTDLVHWKELPYALLPDETGRMYSGGGIVDLENTSGMKEGEDDPVFLFYTAAGCKTRWSSGRYFEIAAAYSTDGGKTFKKYERNPLFAHRAFLNRDPKVLWNPLDREWMMLMYREGDRYTFFYSKNLLDWEEGQTVRGYCSAECPDMFYLDADGDPDKKKLILWFCADNYLVGQVKNRIFTPEQEIAEGPSHQVYPAHATNVRTTGGYASQTFTNLPGGRVVQLSWLMVRMSGTPFVSTMSIPNELKLVTTQKGYRLSVLPAEEVKNLAGSTFSLQGRGVEEFERLPANIFAPAMDIDLRLTLKPGQMHVFTVRGIMVVYDDRQKLLILPTGAFNVDHEEGHLHLRFIVDKTSVEIYTADGLFNTTVKTYAEMGPMDSYLKPLYVESNTGVDLRVTKLEKMW